MTLKTRMAIAIGLLFGLLFAALMALFVLLAYFGYVGGVWFYLLPLTFSALVVLAQWWLGPVILKWIYKIEWVDNIDQGFPTLAPFIRKTCADNNIPVPRVGIIRDGNPNAFVFGRTRKDANLVITEGVFRYCDAEEQVAVVGHELGHIVHNDFVVMTVISVIPLVFYSLYIGSRLAARASRGGGRNSGQAALLALVVAVISFIVYMIAQLIVLLVSRYRESWADEFSAKTTKRPSLLASALVKIAYGLTLENRGQGDSSKAFRRNSNALMFSSAQGSRSLVAATIAGDGVSVDKSRVKAAMAWDIWNPWAKIMQLQSSHPLPATRIKALGGLSRELGEEPYVEFDLVKPEHYVDDFLANLFVKHSWWLLGGLTLFGGWLLLGSRLFLPLGIVVAAACGLLYTVAYRYPLRFKPSTVEECLANVKANPVKGYPVILEGEIIGRGTPGLFYSEDLKLQDKTGLMFLDYNQVLGIINFFIGLFGTQQLVGRQVRVFGWYRRYGLPYIDVYKLQFAERTKTTYNMFIRALFAGLVLLVGVAWLALWL
jgi:Zn-dependent protease with chaperone function